MCIQGRTHTVAKWIRRVLFVIRLRIFRLHQWSCIDLRPGGTPFSISAEETHLKIQRQVTLNIDSEAVPTVRHAARRTTAYGVVWLLRNVILLTPIWIPSSSFHFSPEHLFQIQRTQQVNVTTSVCDRVFVVPYCSLSILRSTSLSIFVVAYIIRVAALSPIS